MDFLFTPEQDALRDMVAGVLADHADPRAAYDRDEADVDAVWRRLADLGLGALTVPEAHGGAGAGVVELLVLAEEVGQSCAPVPHAAHAAAVATVLAATEDEEPRAAVLEGCAQGDRLVLVPHGPGMPAPVMPDATQEGPSSWSVTGTLPAVLDASPGAGAVFVARTPDGPSWFHVRDVDWSPEPSLDRARAVATAHLAGTPARPLGDPADTVRVARVGNDLIRTLAAAEAAAVAGRALAQTQAYTIQRHQFGRPIGTFQAVKHRLADMLVQVENARSAAHGAVWALDAGRPTARAVAMAQAVATRNAVEVTSAAIQLHGGIGVTWECDLHLYLRRAKTLQLAHGSPGWHLEQIASSLLDGREDGGQR